MKIIFDIDGTLTDFNSYINTCAIPYFKSKYGMQVIYPEKLEVEDIMDMAGFFCEKYNCSKIEADKMVKKALNKFWVSHRFIKFSLFGRFRKESKNTIKKLMQQGYEIVIFSSRSKTCDRGLIGCISRTFTRWQFLLNGIHVGRNKFNFYENDDKKLEGLINSKADLIFDDKPDIIKKLEKNGKKVICVAGTHNKDVECSNNVQRISTFEYNEIYEKMKNLFGTKNLKVYERAAKSDLFFDKIKLTAPVIMKKFKPIVLHKENLRDYDGESVIYAPNHRSTLDPLVLTGIILKNIHWAALLRFFEGKDSIFNNSKNPILCKITSNLFRKLEYFPIDRLSDNPDANNFNSIRDMNNFLKNRQKVGIFPEGTTRRPLGADFGTFDDAFLHLAKKNNSWIQPITTLWIKDSNICPKVIVNFGQPFKIGDMEIDMALEKFLQIQKQNLEENKKVLAKQI